MSEIQPAMIDIPIYKQTGSYAREHNELPQFRESNLANIACRYAIDKSISDHFDGMHLNPKAAASVIKEFGIDRTLFVLANTVQQLSWDGRFSRENKQWAASVDVPDDVSGGFDRRTQYIANSHPAVLDGFISPVRQKACQLQERPEKKSIRKQLKKFSEKAPKPHRHSRQKAEEVR